MQNIDLTTAADFWRFQNFRDDANHAVGMVVFVWPSCFYPLCWVIFQLLCKLFCLTCFVLFCFVLFFPFFLKIFFLSHFYDSKRIRFMGPILWSIYSYQTLTLKVSNCILKLRQSIQELFAILPKWESFKIHKARPLNM